MSIMRDFEDERFSEAVSSDRRWRAAVDDPENYLVLVGWAA